MYVCEGEATRLAELALIFIPTVCIFIYSFECEVSLTATL